VISARARVGRAPGASRWSGARRGGRPHARLRARKARRLGGIALSAEVGQDIKALAEHVPEKARSLAEANGLTYVREMREGRAADEILKAAADHQCDVIGSRELGGVGRVTMGDTGTEVVLKAPMPVIVVK
jgi:nucleotide-binding universal stress UspA family protein